MTSNTLIKSDQLDYINNNFNDLNALFNNSPYWNLNEYQLYLGHYIYKKIFKENKTALYINNFTKEQTSCIEKWCSHNKVSTHSVKAIREHIIIKNRYYDFDNNMLISISSKSPKLLVYKLKKVVHISDKLKASLTYSQKEHHYSYLSREHGYYKVDFSTLFLMAVTYKNLDLFNILKMHKKPNEITNELRVIFDLYRDSNRQINALHFYLIEQNLEEALINGVSSAYQLLSPDIKFNQLIANIPSMLQHTAITELPVFD